MAAARPSTELDPTVFSGPEKAAVMLLAMGRETAARFADTLSDEDLRALVTAARNLAGVKMEHVEALVEEFESKALLTGLPDGPTAASQLLARFRPDDDPEEFIKARGAARTGDGGADPATLGEVPIERLIAFMENEHPQLSVFILTQLEHAKAADVVVKLPDELRHEIMTRFVATKPIGDFVVDELGPLVIEQVVNTEEPVDMEPDYGRIAGIINQMDNEAADDAIQALYKSHPDQAKQIDGRVFRFEHIEQLSAEDRQALIDGVDTSELTVALIDSEAGLREAILSTLGQRARRMVESELEDGGRTKPEAVQQARRRIAAQAIEKADSGDISLPDK